MTLVRWDAFRDTAAKGRTLEGFYACPQEDLAPVAWVLAVNISRNGQDEVVVKAELPGMKAEEFEVTVEDDTLTLRGEKTVDTEVTAEHFHRIERSYGSFARSLALPATVDADRVKAEYKTGVLTVRLPLSKEARPKQNKVAVAVAA